MSSSALSFFRKKKSTATVQLATFVGICIFASGAVLTALQWLRPANGWAVFILLPGVGFLAAGCWIAIAMRRLHPMAAAILAPGILCLTVGWMFLAAAEWSIWWPMMVAAPGGILFLVGVSGVRDPILRAWFRTGGTVGFMLLLLAGILFSDTLGSGTIWGTLRGIAWWDILILCSGVAALYHAAVAARITGTRSQTGIRLLIAGGLSLCAVAMATLEGASGNVQISVGLMAGGLGLLLRDPTREHIPMQLFSLEGHTLGKYRILQPLGQGGMARVYRAYHPQLNRYAAIKVLRSDLADREGMLARFRREAQAVAALRHPNIIQVFDFDVQDDLYYMVMELVEGDTLKARLNDYRARGERIPLAESVRVQLDVLDGLEYAHQAGVIHRDLKPANILITRGGQAVVSDFGIAQIIGGTQHTTAGTLMGTLHYMAPEQGMERGDTRSDIYSLGVMLYEMLIGKPPFDADTPLAILMKHMNDPLPLPRAFRPEIPDALERVIFRALSKSPAERFQTAAEMREALRQAAAEADMDIPEHLSPAQSFSTLEAPGEPVAVYSGGERVLASDPEISNDRTDVTLGEKIQAAVPRKKTPEANSRKIQILWTVLAAAVLLFGFIAFAINNAALTGNFIVLERGWPVFILLPGIFLCLLGEVLPVPALIVPVPLFAFLGLLLGFYSVTDRWTFWAPWLLTPFAILLGVGFLLWHSSLPKDRKSDTLQKIRRGILGLMIAAFFITPVALAVWSLFSIRTF